MCGVLLLTGCAGTPAETDASIRTTPPLTGTELARVAKRELNDCITAFYEDDWTTVLNRAKQLEIVAKRWQEQPAPEGKDAEFQEHADKFVDAVAKLTRSATAQNVQETTVALREVSSHLATLRQLEQP